MVKLNIGGLIACGVYVGLMVMLLGPSYFLSDIKGQTLVLQLALFPVLAPLAYLHQWGLPALVGTDSWINNLYVLGLLSLATVYAAGCGIRKILGWMQLLDEEPPSVDGSSGKGPH